MFRVVVPHKSYCDIGKIDIWLIFVLRNHVVRVSCMLPLHTLSIPSSTTVSQPISPKRISVQHQSHISLISSCKKKFKKLRSIPTWPTTIPKRGRRPKPTSLIKRPPRYRPQIQIRLLHQPRPSHQHRPHNLLITPRKREVMLPRVIIPTMQLPHCRESLHRGCWVERVRRDGILRWCEVLG